MLYKSSEHWWAFLFTIVFAAFFALICISSFAMFPLWAWIVLGLVAIVAICLVDIPDKNGNWRFRSSIGGMMIALIAVFIACSANEWREQHPKHQAEVVCERIRVIHPKTSNIYLRSPIYVLECDKGAYRMYPTEHAECWRHGDTLNVEFYNDRVKVVGRK